MAQAQFHKNQRVYVKPVGTWALIERVVPYWTKGLNEPIRVNYDVGMGREFEADELQQEMSYDQPINGEGEEWRIVRMQNKWQSEDETNQHPYPGTYPVLVTGEADWGGWRVPGAEYALSPTRVERQARMMISTPRLSAVVKQLSEWAKRSPAEIPDPLLEVVREARELIDYIGNAIE